MGNCLVTQDKIIKVMKTDGKVLEYKSPIKIHQVLSDFAGHAISDKLPVVQHLHPDIDMVVGNIYYLLPLPLLSEEKQKKRVRFANPAEEARQESSGVVRIKLVMTKKELHMMLNKGSLSVDDMLSNLKEIKQVPNQSEQLKDDSRFWNKEWKPELESIPE
ncbi:uncharacterized protein LOC124939140 [Impatiens glandulifera]|uniref:uncharacterized protein LOC124939140 n=1 Tax=Impatiens glandulifera TaxID=253017 RepID=UPI001FB077CA|nr:uncharacterized protein LOC124939140 [Impatiens glandulifera]